MADSQKTEQPTQRRLLKAREQGNFLSSRQFLAGTHFLAFVAILHSFGAAWFASTATAMEYLLHRAFDRTLTPDDWQNLMLTLVLHCALPVLGAGATLMLLSLVLQLGMSKMGLSFHKLTPDFGRLNPVSRLKQVFRHNLTSLVQALIMLPVSGYVVYAIVADNQKLISLPLKSIRAAQVDVFDSLETLLWRAASLFFVFGCVDLFREQRKYTSDLRMSKQDIKDEHKQSEGNPQMKMRVRRIQRDMARKRMMQAVPTATAVIVNPTHYAVAIRYEPGTMAAPLVVAKGKNYLALRIRQKALDHQVPLVENPPLARGLYTAVDVGQEIPPHLYKAVAEILAYIFRLMHRR